MGVFSILAGTAGAAGAAAGPPGGHVPDARAVERAEARFDLDGDGRDELVTRTAFQEGPSGLSVRYSGTSRHDVVLPVLLPDRRVYFLPELTAGDFNGDGFKDLAIGAGRSFSTVDSEYGVYVYPGGAAGVDQARATFVPGVRPGTLAAGDLDGDGYDELAVGDTSGTEANPFRGIVTVFSGAPGGLDATSARVVRQVVPHWPGLAEEIFGALLAIGDVGGDGYGDLVVGGSRRGEHETDLHGMVTLFPGSADGLDPSRVSKLEGQVDIAGSLPVDLMLLSDLNRDGRQDLVLGLPRYADGQVVYLPGASGGLVAGGARVLDLDTPGIPGEAEDGPASTAFGFSLAVGDATGDGISDLVVGAVGARVAGVPGAGSVTLVPGTPQGPTGAGSRVYTQGDPNTRRPNPRNLEPAEPNDYLGSSVTVLDLDGTGPLEIFAETRYEDFWADAAQPSGLITRLRLQSSPAREAGRPVGAFLMVAEQIRPADFATPGRAVWRLGQGLLGGAQAF